jgi:hypothetical protein
VARSIYLVNTSRNLPHRFWLGAAALWLMAALLRWWIAAALELRPTDYVAETSYTAKLWSRQTVLSAAEESESIVRRWDQTLTSRDRHSIVQGDAHWLTTAGVVIFETLNLYGIDRYNRQNLAGYGSEDRSGQYLFPPHVEKKQHGLWAGFESLPDVPEKYRALCYGKGPLWIEPVSGAVVDYEDAGRSYFIETKTGECVGEPMALWCARYAAETIKAQFRLATTMRGRMRALELWLPLTFATAGLIWISVGFCTRRRGAR